MNIAQRIAAIWILYKFDPRKFNPFFYIFDNVLTNSDSLSEQQFVKDLVMGEKIEEYSAMSPDSIECMRPNSHGEKIEIPSSYFQIRDAYKDS